MTGNSESNLVGVLNVNPNQFYSTQICLKNFNKNIVNTRIFYSRHCLPWHYLSNSFRDPLMPASQGKTQLDPAWDIQLVFAQGRNCSFGYLEQTGQHPNNSAVAINATRTRFLYSLYYFLNLKEKKSQCENGYCHTMSQKGGTACHAVSGAGKEWCWTGTTFQWGEVTTPLSSCPLLLCLYPFCSFSVKTGPQGRKSALFCSIGLSRLLQVQRVRVKAQKDNVPYASW